LTQEENRDLQKNVLFIVLATLISEAVLMCLSLSMDYSRYWSAVSQQGIQAAIGAAVTFHQIKVPHIAQKKVILSGWVYLPFAAISLFPIESAVLSCFFMFGDQSFF
jgi:hypothetical protein